MGRSHAFEKAGDERAQTQENGPNDVNQHRVKTDQFIDRISVSCERRFRNLIKNFVDHFGGFWLRKPRKRENVSVSVSVYL